MSNTFATLPVMAGDDVPAGPVDPIFNRLLKDRIIWMGEEVKDDMANRICAQLLMLAAEDPKKDIWLYINSPGGSITAGMAIYDTMQLIEPDVATVGLGMCASMGQFLLSSGTKGKRYLTSHAGSGTSSVSTPPQSIMMRSSAWAFCVLRFSSGRWPMSVSASR